MNYYNTPTNYGSMVMINHGLKMLKRAIDERPKGGMQTGMPKIQIREADAVRAVAELEWAQQRITELEAQLPKWISIDDKKPDVLKVRVKLLDGSEVNCWSQSDGDFYWKGGGSEMFICEHTVTHWIPQPPKEQDDE